MDVAVLRANGVGSVVALGGASVGGGLFERLADHGVQRVVLAFDNDEPGRTATAKAIDAAVRAPRSPDLWAVDPDIYGAAKDPGDVVRSGGPDAWRRAVAVPCCAVTWRALDLTGPIPTTNMQTIDKTGLRIDDATSPLWLGTTPSAWGDVVHHVGATARTAAEVIEASGLGWTVEQHPVEAVIERPDEPAARVLVPRVVANVRADTRAVLGVVGQGYESLQNRAALPSETRWLTPARRTGWAPGRRAAALASTR